MKLVRQVGIRLMISFCIAVAMLLTARGADDTEHSASHPDLTGIVKDDDGKP
jgi:hypothetical protein